MIDPADSTHLEGRVRGHDAALMELALAEAERGRGSTSPNPLVGAVVVDESGAAPVVLSRGYHVRPGLAHGEAVALGALGGSAPGKTLYVTLEPCNHVGRTGKCTELVLQAGLSRVVIGMRDPNPRVAGGGVERLRAAGLEVTVGVLEDRCRHQNRGYLRFLQSGRPHLILKAALSLDGRLGPRTPAAAAVDQQWLTGAQAATVDPQGLTGAQAATVGPQWLNSAQAATVGPQWLTGAPAAAVGPQWLTGAQARLHTHRLRDRCDAILVGAGTVLADDPLLTVRLPAGEPRADRLRPPLRVVIDGALRTPAAARLCAPGTLVLTSRAALREKPERAQALRARGVEVVGLPPPSARDVAPRDGLLPTSIDLYAALHCLGERELLMVMCEGGATLHGALLDAGLYDEAALYLAPLFLGDEGLPLLRHFAVPAVSAAPWLTAVQVERLGQDLFVGGLMRRGGFAPAADPPTEAGDVHRPG